MPVLRTNIPLSPPHRPIFRTVIPLRNANKYVIMGKLSIRHLIRIFGSTLGRSRQDGRFVPQCSHGTIDAGKQEKGESRPFTRACQFNDTPGSRDDPCPTVIHQLSNQKLGGQLRLSHHAGTTLPLTNRLNCRLSSQHRPTSLPFPGSDP